MGMDNFENCMERPGLREIPDVPEVFEFFGLSEGFVPTITTDDLVSAGPCLTHFLEPFYKEMVIGVLSSEVSAASREGREVGLLEMGYVLGNVCKAMMVKAGSDAVFRKGYWDAFLADMVCASPGVDDFRELVSSVNARLRADRGMAEHTVEGFSPAP